MKRIILIGLCFALLFITTSCKSTEEADLPKETAPETENLELDKEIAENYTNEIVSIEDVYEIKRLQDEKLWDDQPTYYEIVKKLGSTGINTSDLMYRYEWRINDGRYFHVYFSYAQSEYTAISANVMATTMLIDDYTFDLQIINSKYKTTAEYLYDVFYKNRFDTFANFVSWFGYRNIPEPEDKFVGNSDQADIDRIWRENFDVPVDKIKALNVKAGMSLNDVIVWLGSTGNSSASMNHWWWRVSDDFYVRVGLGGVYGEDKTPKDTIIVSVRYDTKETLMAADGLYLTEY